MDPTDVGTKFLAGGLTLGTALLFIKLLFSYQRTFLGDSVAEVRRLHQRVDELETEASENQQEIRNLKDSLAGCERNHKDAQWQIGILKRQLAEVFERRNTAERTRVEDEPPSDPL